MHGACCQIDCGDASNRALGRAGAERVLAHERATLLVAGRTDLESASAGRRMSMATVPAMTS